MFLNKKAEKMSLKLSLWQKFLFWLHGYVFIRWEKRPGWRDYLPIYLVKCKKHGNYLDYPHGYKEYFSCPKCREEIWKEWHQPKDKPSLISAKVFLF